MCPVLKLIEGMGHAIRVLESQGRLESSVHLFRHQLGVRFARIASESLKIHASVNTDDRYLYLSCLRQKVVPGPYVGSLGGIIEALIPVVIIKVARIIWVHSLYQHAAVRRPSQVG